MDWHRILETAFLVMFGIGLVLTVVMSVMSGAFHHEIGAGSSLDAGIAHDLGGPHIESGHDLGAHAAQPQVGWSNSELPGFSPWSPTVICAALTGMGGVGWLSLQQWNIGIGGSIVLSLFGGLGLGGATFLTLAWVFRHVQSTSHVAAADLIGRRAEVDATIESGVAGAIIIEAGGGRMVVPARCVDSASIPRGAEVEIVRESAGVYHVQETRESWLARSKSGARP
jgi:hypothetical protein